MPRRKEQSIEIMKVITLNALEELFMGLNFTNLIGTQRTS